MTKLFKKIVLTGAAGRLGSYLREPIAAMTDALVSTDLAESLDSLYEGESYVKADLGNLDDMVKLLEGADMVVHFGALGDESPFNEILHSNIVGSYNVWEAAWKNGVRRVVYASSIHAVGMHSKTENIGIDAPHRPDTYYGLSKCFAEDLGSLYWDKRGVESVCLRILSCAQVNNPRSLGSWLSYDDLIQLVEKSLSTPATGFSIVYGISNNDRATVDNTAASFLGYRPKDNAEQFADKVLAESPILDPQSKETMCQGGPFATVELGHSGVASMNIVDDRKS